jgi:hypothetical protein
MQAVFQGSKIVLPSVKQIPPVSTQEYLKVKGIAIPLQAWTGSYGSRKLRLPDF